jgi:hypothetical protein
VERDTTRPTPRRIRSAPSPCHRRRSNPAALRPPPNTSHPRRAHRRETLDQTLASPGDPAAAPTADAIEPDDSTAEGAATSAAIGETCESDDQQRSHHDGNAVESAGHFRSRCGSGAGCPATCRAGASLRGQAAARRQRCWSIKAPLRAPPPAGAPFERSPLAGRGVLANGRALAGLAGRVARDLGLLGG